MNQLELVAKVILGDVRNPEMPDDQRIQTIKDGLKSFAADCLNLQQFLRDKGVDGEAARELMEQRGIDYSGKTKRFS